MEYGYKENYTYKDFVDLISLQHYKDEDAFEKAMIPVINLMFGWPISELEVQKSVNLNRSNKQRLDLVIKNQFVIDFKARGENLENHIPQLVSYLRQNKIDRGLLISPDAILLYDDEKRETLAFFPVDTDNTEDQEDFMNLLSYDENKNNAWERFSERHDEWELEKKIAIEVKNFESDETIIEKYYPEATKKVIAKVRTNVKSNPNYYIKTETPEVSKPAAKQRAVYRSSVDDGEGKPRDILYDLVVNNYDKLKNTELIKEFETREDSKVPSGYLQTRQLPNGKFLNLNYSRADAFNRVQKIKNFLGL